jgi:hypothetical protein
VGRADRDLRVQHLGARFGREAFAAQKSGEEIRIVLNRRVHRTGGPNTLAPIMWFALPMFVVAVGMVECKIFAPGHARAFHVEAIENAALHFLADVEPDTGFEHELKQVDSFAE